MKQDSLRTESRHLLPIASSPFRLAVLLVCVTAGCNSATVGSGETGGSGGGSSSGKGGSGGTLLNLPIASGGTGGATNVCNSSNTSACKMQIPEGCGDGINNQNGIEECDDGNTVPGDGCNGVCKVEMNWKCPKAGSCERKVICGDSVIGPGEVCDDGNSKDGDGCNATCNMQDPAFLCVPGKLCERLAQCGNKRIEPGENCDDGNAQDGDGCSATCQVEGGWNCPTPGNPCKQAPRCGDGIVNTAIGEVCDDGNTKDNDGCSADCKSKGTGCKCLTPGKPCVCPEVKCGNGTLEGNETCDDGNTKAGDGCNATCQIEDGYACPFTNAPCVPDCGDGKLLRPMEQCDPGIKGTNVADACDSTCKIKQGWVCTGDPPNACRKTVCGDNTIEGWEACDDGNTKPNDGCSPTCRFEPNCSASTGKCTSKCGDGLVVNEACDDGNLTNGDGCSSDCKIEAGFECGQPGSNAPTMTVPATYRDFLLGGDFHKDDVPGSKNAITGIVQDTLDGEGKPVLSASLPNNSHITSADSFKQWYRDVSGTNTAYVSSMTLYNNGKGGYVNRWNDKGDQWNKVEIAYYCGKKGEEMVDADGKAIPCTSIYQDNSPTECMAKAAAGMAMLDCYLDGDTYKATFVAEKVDGNPLFFPVDNIPNMITPLADYTVAKTPPIYSTIWTDEPSKAKHNFSFTSEVRYWFSYLTNNKYVLDFTGDDDVWVFVHRKLAVDLGGIHTPVQGKLEFNATGGATVTVNSTEGGDCTKEGVPSTCKTTVSTVNLGMTNSGVYEIVVFQAERAWYGSTYKLTLSGFNDQASVCGPICGDKVVSPGEQCDNGKDQNVGGYNHCTSECKLGPFCGDSKVDEGKEECDNGKNNDEYGSSSGCAPGCKLPARCGDKIVQNEFDEECDNGPDNLTTKDPKAGYGGCLANCKRGEYCGDGIKNGNESCDDGVNDGTYGTCGVNCTPAPKCGDKKVDTDYGEECEPMMSNDPDCTAACRKPGGCGDGIVQDGEACDDGAALNLGKYGECAPGCVFAPHCGDAIKNGLEDCDAGIDGNLGEYGGCTKQCKLGPHCGDKVVNGDEECDSGDQNGKDNFCSASCKKIIYIYY